MELVPPQRRRAPQALERDALRPVREVPPELDRHQRRHRDRPHLLAFGVVSTNSFPIR
jgi:hypothetical protein